MTENDKQLLRAHLPDWLHEKGYPTRKSFCCLNPAHPDHNPSMSYNPHNQTVHCFSCGATYDLFQVIGLETGQSEFSAQLETARRRYGSPLSGPVPGAKSLPGTGSAPADFTAFAQAGAAARTPADLAYFSSRGIPAELVDRFGLFLKDSRAVLPVWQNGRCVSWCARALSDSVQPRYRNSPGPMGIWGADILSGPLAPGEEPSPVALCEGVFDALSLEVCGLNALALCGAANTGKFLSLLRALPGPKPRFVLAGDTDPAGQTMNDALQKGLEEQGIPSVRLHFPPGQKDANEALIHAPDALRAALAEAIQGLSVAASQETQRYSESSMAGQTAEFLRYLDSARKREALSSGLPGLDAILDGGFWPGLYVLGAPSSLGKTTLALQFADAIARQGRDVLFFSLEMSRWELLAKSLSRLAGCGDGACRVREILRGSIPDSRLRSLLSRYQSESGEHLFVHQPEASLTPEALEQCVAEHRENRSVSPVVIVDYLQILAPSDPRSTDKQNMDRAVSSLKRLSRRFDTPVLAVSSFNRESYAKGAVMEAFKESGAVEYSADVLLGLQLSAVGREGADLNAERLRSPRQEDLVLLKNRSGLPFARLPLLYHAAENTFEECVAPQQQSLFSGQPVKRIGPKR